MSVRSPKILLVDDDDSLRRVLEFQLVEAGYSVVTSGTGREALEFFSDEEFDFGKVDFACAVGDSADKKIQKAFDFRLS